ncbi:immunoglobulin I-set domain protein [mine drainage metagenome]|uniref:Immunoglobulin I-set domain protein n=1 Tax=mine drainage metagenome TaxID=410659 RepID=A0A1J5SDF6_9ZZZZ
MAGLAVWAVVDSTPVIFEPAMNSTFTGEVRHEFTGSRMIGSGRRWLRAITLAAGFALGSAAIAAPTLSATSDTRQVLAPGQALALSVTATGTGTLSYQWYHDNRKIDGATSATYDITQVAYADAGAYTVIVTDSSGTATSEPIFALVAPTSTQLIEWGASEALDPQALTDISDAVAVAAGDTAMLWVRRDGSVAGVGDITVPSGLGGVVAVALGGKATGHHWGLALEKDGTVAAIGPAPAIPAWLTGVVAVAASADMGFALRSDGTIVAIGSSGISEEPPEGLSDVVSISAGPTYLIALKSEGTLVITGLPAYGAPTTGAPASGVSKVYAGNGRAFAQMTDGSLVGWGDNTSGAATLPAGLSNISALASGLNYSLALKADGTLASWGVAGEDRIPTMADNVFAVSAASTYAVALRDASKDAPPAIVTAPVDFVGQTDDVVNLAVTAKGTGLAYQWRRNGVPVLNANKATCSFQLEEGTAGNWDVVVSNTAGSVESSPARVQLVTLAARAGDMSAWQVVRPGEPMDLGVSALTSAPLTYRWFLNNRAQAGETGPRLTRAAAGLGDTGVYSVEVSDGSQHQRIVFYVRVAPAKTDVYLLGDYSYSGLWGWNSAAAPVDLFDVVDAIPGFSLRPDGSVYSWAPYASGGVGATPTSTRVPGVSDVVALADDAYLKSDGTVGLWTAPATGFGDVPMPVDVASVVQLVDYLGTNVALRADGSVVAWGNNRYGQCNVPSGLGGVVSVGAGLGYAAALREDGTVVVWGDPSQAQVSVPAGLGKVAAMAAGPYRILVKEEDGTVTSWGLGGNDPRVPSGLGGAVALCEGSSYSACLNPDGSVVSWGVVPDIGARVPMAGASYFGMSTGASCELLLRDASHDPVPTISSQPVGATAKADSLAVLSCSATAGGGQLLYQWYKDGVVIDGATSASLIFSRVGTQDAGTYTVVVTGTSGSVTSTPAVFSVTPVDHLLALSTRCFVGTGAAVAVQGLVLKQPAVVLLRAAGPSLANYGVNGVLRNPVLTLYDVNGKALVSDQGWQNPPIYLNGTVEGFNGEYGMEYDRAQVAAAVQAFPFTSPDDSAIAIRLPAGVYTMEVTGADGQTGTAMTEAYFYQPMSDHGQGDRMIAVSTRCHIGIGDSIAVVGLSLEHRATMLLRAVGPSLANYQVSGVLAKPTMTVYDGAGNVVATNTGWNADATQAALITQAEQQVGEFPLTSPDDSAMLLGLKPGLYTIQVKGADGGSGNALVEAYFVHDGL